MQQQEFYRPRTAGVEASPNALQMFHASPMPMGAPHWHAQIEVNYVLDGSLSYRMGDCRFDLKRGDLCLFWGGQPHQLDTISADLVYAGAHLPLVNFFRLRLTPQISSAIMQGALLVSAETDRADRDNFVRWHRYWRSSDPAMAAHAVEELLLRLERICFENYRLLPETMGQRRGAAYASSGAVMRMCDHIAANFRDDVDAEGIAAAAGLHPKYAMTLFKKATGMTLNAYLTLLRLSFAQARLLAESANILDIAMDSGFGSVSAFNKSFRKMTQMSPTHFRRAGRGVPVAAD